MNTKAKPKDQPGGVNISGVHGNFSVGGDIVGGDKITTTTNEIPNIELLTIQFDAILKQIEQRPPQKKVDKSEIKAVVGKIHNEVRKGDKGDAQKVEHWLRFLASMADDIFQVTVAALTNPVLGISKACQLIAQKAKEEK
jgi:hypothetical protein